MYLENAWYVAAWSHEVTREPVRREICAQPVVLYRRQDGTPVALADRCAHRAFPLSSGRVVGDGIECGYHGFTFGCDGVCTKVPGQSVVPQRALVRPYPLHEKDGWVWIWTGDPERADAADIPDTHWMNDPGWATVTHSFLFECPADLVHDNLLDLTHETFLHKTTVGDDYIPDYGITVEVDGDTVTVDRFMPGVEAPPLYASTMGISGPYDRFHATEFAIPGHHTLHSGITPEGRPREEGYLIKVLNGITPIDEHTCWYYYAFSRNFAVENDAATADLKVGLHTVLEEDAEALRLQYIGMRSRPAGEHDVLIAQDAGVAKARRLLAKKIAAERAEQGAPAVPARAARRGAPTPV